MNLNDLIKSAEEKLANPDLTLGTRRRQEAILHNLTSLEMYVDFAGGVDYTVDNLIRHKWPEEKPEELGYYLVRMRSGIMAVLPFNDGCFYIDDYMLLNYADASNPITHWWNLPEETE